MKIKPNLAFTLLALCLGVAVSPAASSPADQIPGLPPLIPAKLEKLGPEGRKAIEEAHQAVQAHPHEATVNGKLGMVLDAHDLLEDAETCYRRAALLEPSSFRWKYYLASILMRLGNVEDASAMLRVALPLDPGYLPAQLRMGEFLLASGKWQEAEQVFREVMAEHPERPEAYYGLGRVQAVRNDLAAAVAHFRKTLEIAPHYGAVHYALAQTYKRQGKMEEAVEHLKLYEQNRRGERRTADPLIDEVQALRPNPADDLRKGMELARQGKLAEGAALIENLLQSHPRLVDAHVELIALYAQLGQFAKGEEHYLAAKRLDPNHPGSFFNQGVLLARQGSFARAEREFRRVLEINPAYPKAHAHLAFALEAQNRWSEAAAVFQQALEIDPDDFQAHFGLGRVYVKQENYRDGLPHLARAAETNDEDSRPAYLYALGAAWARSGDVKKGIDYLHQAREKALARVQHELVRNIDQDLRTLEAARPSP